MFAIRLCVIWLKTRGHTTYATSHAARPAHPPHIPRRKISAQGTNAKLGIEEARRFLLRACSSQTKKPRSSRTPALPDDGASSDGVGSLYDRKSYSDDGKPEGEDEAAFENDDEWVPSSCRSDTPANDEVTAVQASRAPSLDRSQEPTIDEVSPDEDEATAARNLQPQSSRKPPQPAHRTPRRAPPADVDMEEPEEATRKRRRSEVDRDHINVQDSDDGRSQLLLPSHRSQNGIIQPVNPSKKVRIHPLIPQKPNKRRSTSTATPSHRRSTRQSKGGKRPETQLKFYGSGWQKVLTSGKAKLHLHIVTVNAFSTFGAGIKLASGFLKQAQKEHKKIGTVVEAGQYHEGNMSNCIQKEGSTYRSTGRKIADASVRDCYGYPTKEKSVFLDEDQREEAETMIKLGTFLHLYNEDGTIFRNFEDESISTFCISFYYGENGLAREFPDFFAGRLPPRALAFGCLSIYHALRNLARKRNETLIEFRTTAYQQKYEEVCGVMDRILLTPQSKTCQEFEAYLAKLASAGSVLLETGAPTASTSSTGWAFKE
ncbi:hypothetical protein BDN72DRAFT_856251 [Pluteus cervinus]|uniref:Uncharacterized protein n=1 Tax=Pluteus cervinus TaxID=181527 RepID=A0ACD3B133_9AGAR|nr:hypothetical protein BDN72DRAFT_856251 [Pluteus cervinus]